MPPGHQYAVDGWGRKGKKAGGLFSRLFSGYFFYIDLVGIRRGTRTWNAQGAGKRKITDKHYNPPWPKRKPDIF
jgi:hypothetical protein